MKWAERRAPTTNRAYGKGQFVAVGGHIRDPLGGSSLDFGSIITSNDGVNWVLRLSGIANGVRRIAYGNGQFVAMGDFGTTLTSSDGVNWTQFRLSAWNQQYGGALAYGNGHFVVVGSSGTLFASGAIITLAIAPNSNTGLLSLSLEGPTGLTYSIQSSTDLVSWDEVTKITSTQSSQVTLNGLPVGVGRTFYRAYSQ